MAGEGDLFYFHGAFAKRSDAAKKQANTPGSFIRPVYYQSGMRFALLTANRDTEFDFGAKANPVVRIRSMAISRLSHRPEMLPKGPKVCRCGSRKNIKLDHKNGDPSDIRRANHQWLCNACNVAKGIRNARLGRGKKHLREAGQNRPHVGELVMVKAVKSRKSNKPARKLPPGTKTLRPASTNPNPTLKSAARLYKKFIGKGAAKVTRIATKHPAAAKAKGGKLAVAKLARLSYLKIKNPAIQGGMIRFTGAQRPQLLSHPSGRQYYIAGGNQKLDGIPGTRNNPGALITAAHMKRAGLDKPNPKGLLALGEVTEIGYFERKKVEDFRPTEYYHHFGEENGKRPILVYDSSNKQIHLVGGDYRTLWSGINN